MREWIKIAVAAAAIGLFGADFGLRTVVILACDNPTREDNDGARVNQTPSEVVRSTTGGERVYDPKPYRWCPKAIDQQKKLDEWAWGTIRDIKLTDIFLAAFTLMLVSIGRQQAAISLRQRKSMGRQTGLMRRQAKIMARQLELEPPQLFPIIWEHTFDNAFHSLAATTYVTSDVVGLTVSPQVTFSMRNYGRSPAILVYVNCKVDWSATAPSEDTSYLTINLPDDRIIDSGEPSGDMTVGMSGERAMRISRSHYNDLQAARGFLWFFGAIGFDDVWGNKNKFHFCWRYDYSLRVFEPHPRERNYTERLPDSPHDTSPAS